MYRALDLAKYIVSKCVKDEYPISNLQLQKILYYIQRDYLKRNTQAFSDEIQAWAFGPVVPNVYYHFCGYGAMPIAMSYDNLEIQSEDRELIDKIVEEKRMLDPWDLVAETHRPGGAWEEVYKDSDGRNNPISCALIKEKG